MKIYFNSLLMTAKILNQIVFPFHRWSICYNPNPGNMLFTNPVSLTKFGVNMQNMRGQGYDGAAAMSGQFQGAQRHVGNAHPLALYVHCCAHSLNLAVSDACAMAPIRNCLGTIGSVSVYTFLNTPKRSHVLCTSIEKLCPSSHIIRLIQMCPTR